MKGSNIAWLLGFCIVFLLFNSGLAWWNTAWLYRKPITITEQSGNNLTDYQVAINVSYSPNMQSDFSDLRFTWYNSTSGTEVKIPYWIEQKVDSSWAYVWIKVPFIPANGNATVYIYYGNTTPVQSESNGTAVFDFFDDFEDGNLLGWNCLNGGRSGSCSVSLYDGKYMLNLTAPNIYNRVQANTPFNCTSTTIGCKITVLVIGVNIGDGLLFGFSDGTMSASNNDAPSNGYYYSFSRYLLKSDTIEKIVAGTITRLTSLYFKASDGVYYRLSFSWYNNTLENYRNNQKVSSAFDTQFSSFNYIFVSADYGTWLYDWVLVRKFTEPEPTYTIGTEETISLSSVSSITLIYPKNYDAFITSQPTFKFKVIGNSINYSCSLIIDGVIEYTNSSVYNDTITTMTPSTTLSNGNHTWYIECDGNVSETRIVYTGGHITGCANLVEAGTYYVDNDIVGQLTSDYSRGLLAPYCFSILNKDASLNCNGHKISGFNYYGVYINTTSFLSSCTDYLDTIVENCTFDGGVQSIYVYGCSEPFLGPNLFTIRYINATSGIYIESSSNTYHIQVSEIRNVTINSTLASMRLYGVDIYSTYGISDSVFYNNVYIGESASGVDSRANIYGSKFYGSVYDGAFYSILHDNEFYGTLNITNTAYSAEIYNNKIRDIGIEYYSGSIHKIYNNLINGSIYFINGISSSSWNTTKTYGTNIVGGFVIGGNYWAKPDGTGFSEICQDNDKDGICDYAFDVISMSLCIPGQNCTNNTDFLPLSSYINRPPVWSDMIQSFGSTTIYDGNNKYNFQINWTDPDNDNILVYFELTFPSGISKNITPNVIGNTYYLNLTQIELPAGTYQYRWIAEDSRGAWNETSIINFTINKGTPSVLIDNPLNKTYDGSTDVVNISVSTFNNQVACDIYLNGILKGNTSTNINYYVGSAGTYNFTVVCPETQNYTYESKYSLYIISKATPTMTLQIPTNKTYDSIPSIVNYSISTYNNQLYANLYVNNLLADSTTTGGEKSYASAGLYCFVFNTTGNENYTANELKGCFEISKAVPVVTFELPLNKTYDGNISIANFSVNSIYNQVSCYLYLNGVLRKTFNTEFKDYLATAGTYSYNMSCPETQNYTGKEITGLFIISKATPTMTYYIPPNKTYDGLESTAQFIIKTVNNQLHAIVELNGNIIGNITNSLEDTRATAGVYCYSFYTLGNENYTSVSYSGLCYEISKATPTMTLQIPTNKTYDSIPSIVNYSISTYNNQLYANLYVNNLLADSTTTGGEKSYASAGLYCFVFNTTGNENYTANELKGCFEISKAVPPRPKLYINGKEENITIISGSTVNITLVNPTNNNINVRLTTNIPGWNDQISLNKIINVTKIPNISTVYNITGILEESQNYTSNYSTFYLIVYNYTMNLVNSTVIKSISNSTFELNIMYYNPYNFSIVTGPHKIYYPNYYSNISNDVFNVSIPNNSYVTKSLNITGNPIVTVEPQTCPLGYTKYTYYCEKDIYNSENTTRSFIIYLNVKDNFSKEYDIWYYIPAIWLTDWKNRYENYTEWSVDGISLNTNLTEDSVSNNTYIVIQIFNNFSNSSLEAGLHTVYLSYVTPATLVPSSYVSGGGGGAPIIYKNETIVVYKPGKFSIIWDALPKEITDYPIPGNTYEREIILYNYNKTKVSVRITTMCNKNEELCKWIKFEKNGFSYSSIETEIPPANDNSPGKTVVKMIVTLPMNKSIEKEKHEAIILIRGLTLGGMYDRIVYYRLTPYKKTNIVEEIMDMVKKAINMKIVSFSRPILGIDGIYLWEVIVILSSLCVYWVVKT